MPRKSSFFLALILLAGCGGTTTETPAVSEKTNATPQATAPVAAQQSLDELLKLAEAQLQGRDANGALRTLTTAIEQHPQDSRAFVRRGTLLADAGLLPAAIKDMTAAIELDPQNAKLLNTRGYFFLLSKNYDWAYKDFSDAVGRDLQYPQPYNNRGLVQIAKEEYTAAVKEFDAALMIDSDYVDALNNRGFALMQLDRTDEAIASFSKALEINPKYLNALNNRGRAYHKVQKYAEAVADFTTAIEQSPGNLQYYAHRAESNRVWGHTREARQDTDHIVHMQELVRIDAQIRHQPADSELWVARGNLLTEDGQTVQAIVSFDKAIEHNAECAAAFVGKARVAAIDGDWKQTQEHCNKALAIEASREALSLRGDAHYQQQNLDAALTDYSAARRMDSHVAQAYKQRAERYKQEGKADLAEADLQIAVSFDPSLGDGTVVPASATVPAREPSRFPSAEQLEEFRKHEQQKSAEVVPANLETVTE